MTAIHSCCWSVQHDTSPPSFSSLMCSYACLGLPGSTAMFSIVYHFINCKAELHFCNRVDNTVAIHVSVTSSIPLLLKSQSNRLQSTSVQHQASSKGH